MLLKYYTTTLLTIMAVATLMVAAIELHDYLKQRNAPPTLKCGVLTSPAIKTRLCYCIYETADVFDIIPLGGSDCNDVPLVP